MAPTTPNACPPPPTTNKLDAAQRARVIRSSRKLGAVLGTTPFLLESCGSTVAATLHPASRYHDAHLLPLPSHVKLHHRECSVSEETRASSESLPLFALSRSSSSSKESLLSMSEPSTEELPVPLVIAARSKSPGGTSRPIILLNPAPMSSSDSRVQNTSLSPLAPYADEPSTPTSPVELSRTEIRRRKMARVVRTLGENVPPELVFHSSDADSPRNALAPTAMLLESRSVLVKRSTTKSHRRRSASLGSSPPWQQLSDPLAPVFSSSSRAPEDQRWVGGWNRRNITQVQRELRTLRRR
ncbi:hypothetical protein BJV74DRAFT_815843 [Russula compacta]|nr:hypothetical protein BJV74DRAFT_815843 [Russula compacta]